MSIPNVPGPNVFTLLRHRLQRADPVPPFSNVVANTQLKANIPAVMPFWRMLKGSPGHSGSGGNVIPPSPPSPPAPTPAYAYPLLARLPKEANTDDRLKRGFNQLSSMWNSLVRQSILVQTGPEEYTLRLPPGGGVLSFNNRTGIVTLTAADVTAALGYTPLPAAVVSITAGSGLSGGTITTSGTLSLNLGESNTWSGSITSTSYICAQGSFTEGASVTGVFIGVTGGTPRIMFADSSSSTFWEIDNASGTLRWFLNGSVQLQFTSSLMSFSNNLTVGADGVAPPYSSTRFYVYANVGGNPSTIQQSDVYDQNCSGTPSGNFGGSHVFRAQDSTTPSQLVGEVQWSFADITHTVFQGLISIGAHDWNTVVGSPRIAINAGANGTEAVFSLFNAVPIPQPPAIPQPSGGTVIDAQCRAAVIAILNLLGQATGGYGATQ